MKIYLFLLAFVFTACTGKVNNGQSYTTVIQHNTQAAPPIAPNPYSPVDVSPLDLSYYPVDFPKHKMAKEVKGMPVARIIYSRPHRQGRKIFGELLKYGEPWRLGANEATEIELFQDVTIQNKRVPKGKYILYCIPQPDKWTLVFNSNIFSWGLRIDRTKDLYKFEVPVQTSPVIIEDFTMVFEDAPAGTNLLIAWDDVIARLPIALK